jgi:hypothetical protein
MFDSNEKPKNKRQSGIYISNIQLMIFFGIMALFIVLAIGGLLAIQSNEFPAAEFSIPELNGMEFGVDAAQGWQATGLRLEEGQRFIISYREGDWSIFPEDSFRYGPDGGASACEGSDCVEPLAGYTKSGLIGRIGDSQPFVVGSYLETTAQDSGMLQLRVNDAGTHDNEGFITVLLTWEN